MAFDEISKENQYYIICKYQLLNFEIIIFHSNLESYTRVCKCYCY